MSGQPRLNGKLSERLINRGLAGDNPGEEVCRWAEMTDAGLMIPICEDQEPEEARACPGYAPAWRRGQGLSQ
jgi:hypothetical protein